MFEDFSSVTLPGVGGSINPATAISTDKLEEINKSGKKWRTGPDGNLMFHNEAILKSNKNSRSKRESLINRDRNENASGMEAMAEIMGIKRSRIEAFKEIKRKEYSFVDDSELISMPQPFLHKECEVPGKCSCSRCQKELEEFREWTSEKRKKLLSGELKGEFAGPNMTFPISGTEDVSAAWSSTGRASNPRKTMAEIIRIAKKYGWEAGLPQTVRDRLERGESGLPSPNYREWTTKEREKLKRGDMQGDFAGPGMSFPISGPKDVSAAWSSVGRAGNPDAVMRRIIEIAKKNGWESSLPESVKQRLKEGRSGLPE